MLIPLCKNNNERYHFNILRIINIIYHIYIESEFYQLAYGTVHNYYPLVYFSNKKMVKWKDHDYFIRNVIVQYSC